VGQAAVIVLTVVAHNFVVHSLVVDILAEMAVVVVARF